MTFLPKDSSLMNGLGYFWNLTHALEFASISNLNNFAIGELAKIVQ
mgnify:CR=1 FL=1